MGADRQPIEGQLVKSESVVVGGHVFRPVVFGRGENGKLHRLSQNEARFLDKFFATGNIELASAEIGIDPSRGLRYLERKHIKAYVEDMMRQAALASGLTIEKLMADLHDGIEGVKSFNTAQRDCLKIAAKMLKPAGSVNINLQQNNIHAAPSPYAGKTAPELVAQLRQVLGDLPAQGGLA